MRIKRYKLLQINAKSAQKDSKQGQRGKKRAQNIT